MPRLLAALLSLALASTASAQRSEASAGSVRVIGQESSCWSNSQAPCEHAERASIRIVTGPRAATVRLERVEIASPERPDEWREVSDAGMLVRATTARSGTQRSLRLRARATHEIMILHARVQISTGALYRVHLVVNGAPVTVLANMVVYTEHPDPEL